jgi:hypothetical protein
MGANCLLVMKVLSCFSSRPDVDILSSAITAKGVSVEHKGEKFEKELERVKWFLWHSNLYKALQCCAGSYVR